MRESPPDAGPDRTTDGFLRHLAALAGCGAAFVVAYHGGRWAGAGRRAWAVPLFGWEAALPVYPLALPVYVSVLPVLWLAFLWGASGAQDDVAARRLRRLVLGVLIALAVAGSCFWLAPTEVPRRRLVSGAGALAEFMTEAMTEAMVELRAVDPPRNALPSLHVALAALAAAHLCRYAGSGWARLALWGWVVAVWGSTVLLEQHAVLDGVAGLSLALGADALAGRLSGAAVSA